MAVLRTKLATVLLALRAQLMAALSFPAERVLLVASEKRRHETQADQVVLVRPTTQRWEKTHDGGGRTDSRVRRRCTVTLRTRLFLDDDTEDTAWLTDATLGHLATEHAILDALEMFIPQSGDDWLVYEPIHLEDAREPDRPREESGWGQAAYSFDLCFVLDLDQSVQ